MKIARIMTFVLFAVMPLSASAAQSVSVKANTIDELVKMYDVSSCKECHKKIYEEWEQSIHARSLIGTGRTMGTFKRTLSTLKDTFVHSGVKEIKDVKKEHLMPCFKCHLPQIKDADDDVARQIAEAFDKGDKAILAKLGINCLVCHNMKALIHQWQDGPPQPGIIYGKKDAPHPDGVFKNLKKSPVITKAVSCGQCHGTGPNFEFPQPSQCATAYGSYLHAYIPAGGTETCQDCHMKKNGKGHLMPAYRDTEMRAEAVDVKIDIVGYKFLPDRENVIPMAVMTLRILNKAGHRIPDGWPSPQRLVMDVTATTKDGKEIFRDSKIFMTQATNSRDDSMIYGPSFKMGYIRDTSLQPLQMRNVIYEIPFPYEDILKDGKKVREVKAKQMDVTIELRYQLDPDQGEPNKDSFVFYRTTETVVIQWTTFTVKKEIG